MFHPLASLILALALLTHFAPCALAHSQPQPQPQPKGDRQVKEFEPAKGVTLRYTIITSEKFDPKVPAPVILLLPPGSQNFQMMSAVVAIFDEATIAGKPWVVVCPQAPDGTTFFTGAEKHIPALLAEVQEQVLVEGNAFHVVGISNGGISAFRIALNHPDRVASITTLPGYPLPEDAKRLERIKNIPVRMHVGSDDALPWIDSAKSTEAELKRLGGNVRLRIATAEGHSIRSMTGSAILRDLESLRKKDGTITPDHTSVLTMLDAFHAAAAKGDENAYFDLFAPEGVFIGTDATERWTVDQFRSYARPVFSKGKGWTYKPRAGNRHVDLSPDATVAWFDELLDNDKYGLCRGSGVCRKVEGQWRITQYHLTVPIPNDLMERISGVIKSKTPKSAAPAKKP